MKPDTHQLISVLIPLDEHKEFERNLPLGGYLCVADSVNTDDLQHPDKSARIGVGITRAFGRALKEKGAR